MALAFRREFVARASTSPDKRSLRTARKRARAALLWLSRTLRAFGSS
jgi:hypothetical protein